MNGCAPFRQAEAAYNRLASLEREFDGRIHERLELKVLEKIASAGKLNIVLGEKGLTDRVVNLL